MAADAFCLGLSHRASGLYFRSDTSNQANRLARVGRLPPSAEGLFRCRRNCSNPPPGRRIKPCPGYVFASFFRGSLRQRSSSVVTHPYRLVLGQPVSCRLASVMAKGSLSSRSKGQFDDRRQNMQIMFVATCALLLAVGNALVPSQKAQTLRARPLAAMEGSAAEAAKKRIARRSVATSLQTPTIYQI